MELRKIKIENMKPAKYNPRKNLKPTDSKYKQIKDSIDNFGYIDPIIWNERTGNIIGGHQRYKILCELGLKEIECVVVNFDDETEKAANLAVNKAQGDWDKEKLDELLREMKQQDKFDMSKFGFNMDKFKKEIQEDEYIINLPEEPKSKLGDIYELGNHRLMCGSATNKDDVEKLMNGELGNLMVTDPPYNVNYGEKAEMLNQYGFKGHKNTSKILNDHMSNDNFKKFLADTFENCNNALKPGASAYVFHSESERINFTETFKNAGFYFSENLIWCKNVLVLGRQDYHYRHEPIIYGWKEGGGHYFCNDRTQTTILGEDKFDIEKLTKDEMRNILHELLDNKTSVLNENKPMRNEMHPTMKPIKLLGILIENSSKANDIVIDLFGGSGSTLIACEETGRKARLMELEPKYCDVIIDRWEKLTGKKAKKIN